MVYIENTGAVLGRIDGSGMNDPLRLGRPVCPGVALSLRSFPSHSQWVTSTWLSCNQISSMLRRNTLKSF